MSEHCGCEGEISYGGDWGDAAFTDRKDCRYPALVALVKNALDASIRESDGDQGDGAWYLMPVEEFNRGTIPNLTTS